MESRRAISGGISQVLSVTILTIIANFPGLKSKLLAFSHYIIKEVVATPGNQKLTELLMAFL